jgi:PAS domain S-box-containing protein
MRGVRKKREEFNDLGRVVDELPALIWTSRADGYCEFLNERWFEYTDLNRDEAYGWGWQSVIHPDDRAHMLETWSLIRDSGQARDLEARIRRFDGEYRWFLFRTCPIKDASGAIVKWCGMNTDIEDRKSSELLLQENEEKFRAIFDEAGTGITLVDLTHEVPIRNNRALQRMLGCTEEELSRYETYDELTFERNREADAATFRELAEGRRDTLRMEKHFILRNGTSVWANVVFTLLRDAQGQARHIIAIHEDITERKLALQRLQANQELLDLAQKAARAMAFDWYIQEDTNTWSPEQEALYGLAPGTFDGKYESWKSLIYPPDWPAVVESLKHASETGDVSVEFRVVWPDGSIHWLMAQGQMFFDGQQRPLRMVGFTADISARKLVEEELRRSEAFLAEGQHLARLGNFTWRVSTNEINWSEQLYRIFGFEPGTPMTLELIGSRVHPDDLPLLYDMVDAAESGASDFEYEHRVLLPDGSTKHLHLIAHRTPDQSGQLEYIGAVQDVTQRRLADEALGKARSDLARAARVQSLGFLTASIAHEVNQPLSGIVTNASTCVRMLDSDPPNVDGARETARRTIRDGNRASEVISRLRTLFGRKDFTLESVDLNEAAQEVIALLRSELQRSQVILKSELADDLPKVEGDRVQLQQVILNLLLNAADAMSNVDDRPRHLTITTGPDENDRVRLRVRDVGVGVAPADVDKIFDAFYSTKKSGMGIGLSVSKTIIESHQGNLWATPNDGPGSTFCFSIPCANQSRKATPDIPDEAAQPHDSTNFVRSF